LLIFYKIILYINIFGIKNVVIPTGLLLIIFKKRFLSTNFIYK